MNGYSRYAATAVWVGNANNANVNDRSFAAANTTVRLFKNWMGIYHKSLKDLGRFATPAGFEELQPANVAYGKFQSATTDRGRRGGCSQVVETWIRTDKESTPDCINGKVPLPEFKRDLAQRLACSRGIPVDGCSARTSSSSDSTPSATVPSSNNPPRQSTPVPQPTPRPQPTPVPTQQGGGGGGDGGGSGGGGGGNNGGGGQGGGNGGGGN
jgi:membrane peptidoglycan carboxypeptidase